VGIRSPTLHWTEIVFLHYDIWFQSMVNLYSYCLYFFLNIFCFLPAQVGISSFCCVLALLTVFVSPLHVGFLHMHVACCYLVGHLGFLSFMSTFSIFPSIYACCLLRSVLLNFYSPQMSSANVTFFAFVPCFFGPGRYCYSHPCFFGPDRSCYIHVVDIYLIHMRSANVTSLLMFWIGNSSPHACPTKFALSLGIVW